MEDKVWIKNLKSLFTLFENFSRALHTVCTICTIAMSWDVISNSDAAIEVVWETRVAAAAATGHPQKNEVSSIGIPV